MRPIRPRDVSRRRRCRPGLEAMEPRDLPSTLPTPVQGRPQDLTPYLVHVRNLLAQREAGASAGGVQVLNNNPLVQQAPVSDPGLVAGFAGTVYGPVTGPDGRVYTDVPQPTPAEIRRETFSSRFVGNYTVGPPRTADRASTIRIYSNGRDAGANQFLHGRAQLLILPPADPGTKPDPATNPIAGLVVGVANFVSSNYLQTSGNLPLDLTNRPGVASDDPGALSHGLPSRLAWTLDQAGAGVYTSPTYTFDTFLGSAAPGVPTSPGKGTTPSSPVDAPPGPGAPGVAPGGTGGAVAWQAGAGEVDLTYLPDRRPKPGTLGSGRVVVKFLGLFNNPGDLDAIDKMLNR